MKGIQPVKIELHSLKLSLWENVWKPGACSTAQQRSNRPDHWDSLMLNRSAVGQLSSLSSYVVYLLLAVAAILF